MSMLAASTATDFERARELFVRPPRPQYSSGLFTISVIIFVGMGLLGSSSLVDVALLAGVLLVHELGHAAAMWVSGYRDVRIFFIPLFGAATSGRATGVATWREGVVLLAGPLPGIVAGLVLAIVDVGPDALVWMLIGVNVFNLLPIYPLDGGQLFRVVLFARHRVVETVFMYGTAGLLAAGGLLLGEYVLAAFGGVMLLVTIPHRRRILAAAHELRSLQLAPDPAALDEPQARLVHEAAWRTLPPKAEHLWRGKPVPQAETMRIILEAATQRPPTAGPTAGLLVAWFAGWILALAAAAVAAPPLPAEPVDWMGMPIGGITATMSPAEAVAACRASGGSATPTERTSGGAVISTVTCDASIELAGSRFTRVEVWYCGTQPCVFELTSRSERAYVELGDLLERTVGKPVMESTTPSCAPHDPAECPRRCDSARTWSEPGSATRLCRTRREPSGDTPVYLLFANADGTRIWR